VRKDRLPLSLSLSLFSKTKQNHISILNLGEEYRKRFGNKFQPGLRQLLKV
jgi:hypothetical protein